MTVFEILPEYYLWNLKKKVESVTTEKQAHSYREQTSIYQGKDRVGGGKTGRGFQRGDYEIQATVHKINKPQGYIVYHRECGDVLITVKASRVCSDGKASACNTGDPGSILGLGRSPGGGRGNSLQYSCQENPRDRGAWQATVHGVTKCPIWLSN